MSTLTIALLQMTTCGADQDANRAKGEAFCRQARLMGADIALFPEMWNIGYTSWPDGQSRDTCVIEAGEREGVYLAHFDLDELRDWRRRETWGNAFRRPHRYGLLTSLAVEPPFVRIDGRGEPYDRASR